MNYRYIILGTAMAFANLAYAKIPEKLLPTKAEQEAMLDEADDFIDNIPDGQQDRQSDAVLHALRGMNAELNEVRNSRNSTPSLSADVDHADLVGDGSARGMSMRLYKPKKPSSGKLPLLIYMHGGGWTFGSINSCAAFCDALAATGDAIVLAIDYSLSPEKPFPAPVYDCVAALEYAAAHAEEWGSDPSLISLGGDSAGGNLAVAASLQIADDASAKVSPKSLLLFYPVTKAYKDNSDSWREYSRGYGLDGRLMEAFNEAYVCDGKAGESGAKNPLVSPAEAADEKLAKLPPILIIGGERDILCDQGEEFAERLKTLGNTVERIEFPGAVHLFITVSGQPTAFRKAVDLARSFLK